MFSSPAYRELVKDYILKQVCISAYAPDEGGLCDRFIRSFKEECAWFHKFQVICEARAVVAGYIDHFNA